MIEAIIFDMDGVLVDSEPFHIEIENRLFKLNGIDVSDEEHLEYMGVATEVMWRKIAERHMLELTVEKLTQQSRTESIRYFSELTEIPVMPGLIDLLEELKQKKYPMAVASSSFPEIIEIILTKTGLRSYFQVVVSSEEAGKSKPEPDVFLLAARKLGIIPWNCLVVEDSFNGIKAAHAAQMSCVAYQSPGVDPRKQEHADVVVKSYKELALML